LETFSDPKFQKTLYFSRAGGRFGFFGFSGAENEKSSDDSLDLCSVLGGVFTASKVTTTEILTVKFSTKTLIAPGKVLK
jgi:hypothetical protein